MSEIEDILLLGGPIGGRRIELSDVEPGQRIEVPITRRQRGESVTVEKSASYQVIDHPEHGLTGLWLNPGDRRTIIR